MKWSLEHLLAPLVVTLVTLYIGISYINPPSFPDIETTVVFNSGPIKKQPSTHFTFDLKEDKKPWMKISIINKGNNNDDDLDIDYSFNKKNLIKDIKKKYYPRSFERRVKRYSEDDISFSHKFTSFPVNASIEYDIDLDNFITQNNDYNLSVLSKYKNWSKSIRVKVSQINFSYPFLSIAYAKDELVKKSSNLSSGIFIGGYDPLQMANGIFILLQNKMLITKEDAIEIKKITESYKSGVLFGGVNILKFDEILINKLIVRNRINLKQANSIIEKSKNAGGVLIGGYNVVILQVELLNTLLVNKAITKNEGQRIIDNSKQP